MPYVRQASLLQRAPRLVFRRRGFGDAATCPSVEQLMGIANPADPCQSGGGASTNAATCPSVEQLMGIANPADPCQSGTGATYKTVSTPSGDYQVFSDGRIFNPAGQQVSSIDFRAGGTPTTVSPTLGQFFAQHQTVILAAGGGLLGLVLLSRLGR